jgi:hypothetical protein
MRLYRRTYNDVLRVVTAVRRMVEDSPEQEVLVKTLATAGVRDASLAGLRRLEDAVLYDPNDPDERS